MRLAIIALLSMSSLSIAAVHVSETGTGQASIVPFYSVANGLNTLVSINNTTGHSKAIKIHIRESKWGEAVYTFNLYLSPNDIWGMGVLEIDGELTPLTFDNSCALNIENRNSLEGFSDINWETGIIEVIEMGSIPDNPDYFFPTVIEQQNCQLLAATWDEDNPDAQWINDPSAEIEPASGGIRVEASVFDVSQGYAFPVPVFAMDHFYPQDSLLHQAPESAFPDLSSGTHESLVYYQGNAVKTTWPTGYEAVSALMMRETLENEYTTESGIAAKTEWVMSFPTLRYHALNPADDYRPFIYSIFDGDYQFVFPRSTGFGYLISDREGHSEGYQCFMTCPTIPKFTLDHTVNIYVMEFDNNLSNPALFSENTIADNGHLFWLHTVYPYEHESGKVNLYLGEEDWRSASIANINGIDGESGITHKFHGLPYLGFSFVSYKNGNAQPGLLATYATSQPHYGERRIEFIEN